MNQMDHNFLYYLMLMTVSIGIQMKILEMVCGYLGKRFHVNFLGYSHWFMSIRIYQVKDHSISVDQARYATSIVAKYLNNATVKVSTNFYKTTFPVYMLCTKYYVSTSDE